MSGKVSALLDALRSASSPDDLLSRLAEAPLSPAARRWIARSDRRALATAIDIAQRWTQLDADAAPQG